MSEVYVGVDVGGTKVSAGLVSVDGSLSNRVSVESSDEPNVLVDVIAGLVEDVSGGVSVSGVGVGVAGFLDKAREVVRVSPNMHGIDGMNVQRLLSDRLGVPVFVENDANVAAWGEFKAGAGVGFNNVCLFTVGTGVGGGVISNGSLVVGSGTAGEVGHFSVVRAGLLCGCGKRGCLEVYASGGALHKLVELKVGRSLSQSEVKSMVESEAVEAVESLFEVGFWLGLGCAVLDAIVNPEVFIFGGGVSDSGVLLLNGVVAGFESEGGSIGSEPLFKIATLGNDAGIVGAGLLAAK